MSKDFSYLFTLNSAPQPSSTLFEKVMGRIHREASFGSLKRHAAIFSVSTVLSALAAVWAWRVAQDSFAQSGFVQFFSLLFSDFGSVESYWQNFTFSLLESLPATSFAILLAFAWAFAFSLKQLAKDMKTFFNFTHIKHTI